MSQKRIIDLVSSISFVGICALRVGIFVGSSNLWSRLYQSLCVLVLTSSLSIANKSLTSFLDTIGKVRLIIQDVSEKRNPFSCEFLQEMIEFESI